MNTQNQDLHLVDYIRPLLSRKWLVLAIVALVTGGTYFYYERQPKEYTASTRILVTAAGSEALIGAPTPAPTDRTTRNQATLLRSREVAALAARRLKTSSPPEAVLGSVATSATAGSDFIDIIAVRPTPVQAAGFANAFARAFVDLRSRQLRSQLRRTLRETRSQLGRLSPLRPSEAAERAQLLASARKLELALSVPSGQAQRLDPAQPPTKASAPRPVRNALFAFALSLVAAIALAFGLERFDRRVKRVDDVEAIYGLPILTVVPHSRHVARTVEGRAALSPDLREAFRQLRSNVQLQALSTPIRRILVTSAIPREGKSMITRNLALAFREFGQSVAVVDADLRRSGVSKLFAAKGEAGLTSVLTGEDRLSDALEEIPVHAKGLDTLAQMEGAASTATKARGGGPGAARNGRVDSATTLQLLASGPTPSNPQAVLAAQRTRDVLDELAESHDILLIDSPPLIAVSDALALAGEVDAVIIVCRVGVSSRDAARRALELLAQVPQANTIGVVANDLTVLKGGHGYDYGYADKS